ncbi:MAG TPA: Rieske 2Fe-2S domain-containing protein [Methanoregula sp.]|nr:Rieske 2Fe-2S domain-containing protein [Methanoregula sp.]
MTGYCEAANVSDLADGALFRGTVCGREILLARAGGQFYATDPLCPHLQADLSLGSLHGTILTCPLHNSQFDLRDGHVVRWTDLSGTVLTYDKKAHPSRPLRCYPVKTEGGRFYILLP